MAKSPIDDGARSWIGDEKTGTPIEESGEWSTVVQEKDYWKRLALSYGAKLKALETVMAKTWTVTSDIQGNFFVTESDEQGRVNVPPADADKRHG